MLLLKTVRTIPDTDPPDPELTVKQIIKVVMGKRQAIRNDGNVKVR